MRVPRRGAAGALRLAAVEPHLRRQPQLRDRALQRRHALHRRGEADAGRVRDARVRNLREIEPTAYFNVPRGYEMLVPHLRADAELRAHFFSRAGDPLLRRRRPGPALLGRAAGAGRRGVRRAHPLVTGLGATESAPFALCTGERRRAGRHGRSAGARASSSSWCRSATKLEARLRGPNITPGYWRDPDARRARRSTRKASTGSGDALRVGRSRRSVEGVRVRRPDRRGLQALDRHLGAASVRCARGCSRSSATYAQDVVIAGHDRDEVTALDLPEPRRRADALHGATLLARDPRVRRASARSRRSRAPRAARRAFARALLLDEPPSIDAREVTDKGSINQKAVLRNRAALVEELYALPTPATRDHRPRSERP